jgi:hypothetical protein
MRFRIGLVNRPRIQELRRSSSFSLLALLLLTASVQNLGGGGCSCCVAADDDTSSGEEVTVLRLVSPLRINIGSWLNFVDNRTDDGVTAKAWVLRRRAWVYRDVVLAILSFAWLGIYLLLQVDGRAPNDNSEEDPVYKWESTTTTDSGRRVNEGKDLSGSPSKPTICRHGTEESWQCCPPTPDRLPASPSSPPRCVEDDDDRSDHDAEDSHDVDVDGNGDDWSSDNERVDVPKKKRWTARGAGSSSSSCCCGSAIDQRMHEWSCGATLTVPPDVLQGWTGMVIQDARRIVDINKPLDEGDDDDDKDDLPIHLSVLAGAIWFRIHVRGQSMEDLIREVTLLLEGNGGSDDEPFSFSDAAVSSKPTIVGWIQWALRQGDRDEEEVENGLDHTAGPPLDSVVEIVWHALRFLNGRNRRILCLPSRFLRDLIVQILRNNHGGFVDECQRLMWLATTTGATTFDTSARMMYNAGTDLDDILRAVATRLLCYLGFLNVISIDPNGRGVRFLPYRREAIRPNSWSVSRQLMMDSPPRNHPAKTSDDVPQMPSLAELVCSLHLVRWCLAASRTTTFSGGQDDNDRADDSFDAVRGLLNCQVLAEGRILQGCVPRAVESWFRDVDRVNQWLQEGDRLFLSKGDRLAVQHRSNETRASGVQPSCCSRELVWEKQCATVMARCALEHLDGLEQILDVGATNEEARHEIAIAMHHLGSRLAWGIRPPPSADGKTDDEQVTLAFSCFERAHRIWAPMLRQCVKDISSTLEALEMALLLSQHHSVDGGAATKQSAAMVRQARGHLLATDPVTSDRTALPASPYWKLAQMLTVIGPELVSRSPLEGPSNMSSVPGPGSETDDRPLERTARVSHQLRRLLDRTGRICHFMASIPAAIPRDKDGRNLERGERASSSSIDAATESRRQVSAELLCLSTTIQRILVPTPSR